jgi:hypothetical protein
MKLPKRIRYCQLPKVSTVRGRSSSITNAFFNAIIPVVPPSDEEVLEALAILELDKDDIRCAYCGDKSTEWDHLRPIIENQKPTGYITEIANLVPACGKCNQSKGKSYWKTWMMSGARLSPASRGKSGLEDRVTRLERYERWRTPTRIDFATLVDPEMWQRHEENWRRVLDLLKSSQELASQIRGIVALGHREAPVLPSHKSSTDETTG